MDPGLQVVHHAERNVVGLLDRTVLMFVRSGPLRPEAFDAVEKTAVAFGREPGRAVGALVVVGGDAGLSDKKLIERQRRFLRGFVHESGDVFVATAVLGDSVQSTAMRAVVRLFTVGNRRIHLSATVEDAARWLGGQLKVGPLRLATVVRDLQKLAAS